MHLQKFRKVFTSKFLRTGPLSYKKRIYRAAVSQRLRNTTLQLLSLAVRSDQTHLLLSPVPSLLEFLSLPANFLMCCKNYAVPINMLHTGLLSGTGYYDRIAVGIFKDK